MLLTSSQVSVAVSSAVVASCTFALFLSGYAIQQRTVREIRAAIKAPARPSPKIFLPDRFKKMTTELEDGTIVTVDDDEYEANRHRRPRTAQQPIAIEVRPTLPETEQLPDTNEDGDEGPAPTLGEPQPSDQDANEGENQDRDQDQDQDQKQNQTLEEEEEEETNDTSNSPPIIGPEPKPISRAERRRRIKEEIMKLSHIEQKGEYQRRLW